MLTHIGNRIKECYENSSKTHLMRRVPVIIRIDGRDSHSFTEKFCTPFDRLFHNAMNETTKYLCENIPGCRLGYTHSDEISLLLADLGFTMADTWPEYDVQKICSVAASMATMRFNLSFRSCVEDYCKYDSYATMEQRNNYIEAYEKGYTFDACCFNIPVDDVTNYFVWRQSDAIDSATRRLGQCFFTQDELCENSSADIHLMMLLQKGINFNNMSAEFRYGVCCKKINNEWEADMNTPIFLDKREYIKECINT